MTISFEEFDEALETEMLNHKQDILKSKLIFSFCLKTIDQNRDRVN
jgi:hypothetical protein